MSTKTAEHVARETQRARLLATAIRTNSSTVVPELNRQNVSIVREGETMLDAAVEQERNARLLDIGSSELTEADRILRDVIAERVFFGEERTMWQSIARGELFSAKTMIQAQGGLDAVAKMGLQGPLADTPEKLILQGRHFLKRLKNPIALRTKAENGSIGADALIQRLTTPFSEFELRHELYLEANQNVATALKAKDDAYNRLRLLNLTIGQETVAAWRRAGFEGLALRLRRQLYRVLRSSSGTTDAPPTDLDPANQDNESPTPAPETTA